MQVATANKKVSRLMVFFTMLLMLVIVCMACGDDPVELPQIGFDKSKWFLKENGQYPYRKQMIKDLLTNYNWTGISKDSVTRMLGKEDSMEEGNLTYYYERKPMPVGLGTTIESIVFELAPDSTVKLARLNDGGWD